MTRVDAFHAGIVFASVLVCIPLGGLDPLTAAVVLPFAIEIHDRVKNDQTWQRTLRDLVFRLLGGMAGILVAWIFGALPVLA